MEDDIIARLREPCIDWTGEQIVNAGTPRYEVDCLLLRDAAASIERLRRLLHKYGDRIPLATNARPDWQQEIDEAFEWVANNPDPLPGWTERGEAWLEAGAPTGEAFEAWSAKQ